jgi:sugar phosphate isomerase/epimerase
MGLNSCGVMQIMEGFDPALVGVFADVGHLSIVGEPYQMAFSIVEKYLCAIAFKDLVRKRNPDGSWAIDVWPMGMVFGNFPQVMQLVKDMNFEGPISFHCEYSRMPPESIIHQLAIDTKFIGDIVAGLK